MKDYIAMMTWPMLFGVCYWATLNAHTILSTLDQAAWIPK